MRKGHEKRDHVLWPVSKSDWVCQDMMKLGKLSKIEAVKNEHEKLHMQVQHTILPPRSKSVSHPKDTVSRTELQYKACETTLD